MKRLNPLMLVGNYSYQFFICCPRDCVSRHNGGTSGAPLKPLKVDSVLRALSSLRGLRGASEVPLLCPETQSLGQQMLELGCENATVVTNGLSRRTCLYKYGHCLQWAGLEERTLHLVARISAQQISNCLKTNN